MNFGTHEWTVGRRIAVGFVALGLVGAALVATFETGIRNLVKQQAEASENAATALKFTETAAMGAQLYQVVADGEINLNLGQTKADWAQMRRTAEERLATVEKLAKTTEEQDLLRTAREHFTTLVSMFESELLPTLERDGAASAQSREIDGRIDEQAAAMANALVKLSQINTSEAEAAQAAFDAREASTQRLALMTMLAGVIAAFVLAVVVVRSVSRRLNEAVISLNEGAQQVVATSEQVAGSAQSLSQGASEQAASLEETSASMEEMASMTRRNAENTRQAVGLVVDVHSKVHESQSALGEMVSSMSAIKESSLKVSKIIKTIDEIAFQTNILALNAAVEAARAGEAGMGFAVVADEVRSLAQRSAQAAKDTAGLIEESITKAQTGNIKVEQVAAAITGITDSVNKVKGLVEEVSEASHQQSQGLDQVAQAISQMEKVTQGTAATAEESAAASEELSAQANTTMEVVGQLRTLVGVKADAHAAPVRRKSAKAAKHASVLAMPARRTAKATPLSNEEIFPLEKTGTYGSF